MNILPRLPVFIPLVALLFYGFSGSAQKIEPEVLGIGQGLSQGYVGALLQDREGFIWAGTKNGLNRYDGRRFKVFTNDPTDPHSLSHDYISTLWEHGDFLLVGTNGRGLNIFHKKTQRFYRMPDPLPDGTRLGAPALLHVVMDAQGDIWVLDWKTFYDGNLYRIHLPPGFWERIGQGEPDWSGVSIRKISDYDTNYFAISQDKQRLYYAQNGALVEVDTRTGESRLHPHPDVTHNSHILDIGQNHLWMTAASGLLQFDGRSWTSIKPGFQASWMEIAPAGDRLMVYLLESKKVLCYTLERRDGATSLGGVSTAVTLQDYRTIMADRTGNTWIGTGGFGLMKISPQTGRFRTYFSGFSISAPPFATGDGGYAIFDNDGGIRVDPPNSRHPVYALRHQFAELNLRGRCVRDAQGNYWLYYLGSGEQNLLTQIPASGGAPRSYCFKKSEMRMGNLALDTGGQVLIGLNGSLYRFDPVAEKFAEYDYRPAQPLGHEVRCLVRTADGRWWIGGSKGLVEARPDAQGGFGFRLWQQVAGSANGLHNEDIACLLPDPKIANTLWIGTKGGGLTRMDIQTGQFNHLTTRNGLPNDVIYAILPDDRGHLWLSSNKGLIRYQPETGQMKHFTEVDGLQSDEFNTWAYAKSPTGELMFGGIKGLNVFNPKNITDNPHLPHVALTGLKVNNRDVLPGDSTELLENATEFTEKVRLPYFQNSVTLEFAALEFTNATKNRFRYYLEGAEPEWVHESAEPSAQYLNLAPGTYTFKVMACNNDGVWNPEPAALQIMVLPPWYRSWWAYLCYAAALGGLLYAWFRIRQRQWQLQQKLALEHREAERIRELDQFKSRLFTNITHEFRTPLTVILGAGEHLEKQATEEKFSDLTSANQFVAGLKNRLSLIRRNGRNLLDLVNQLLDLAKAESNQLKIYPVQGDVVRYVRYIVEGFHSLANQRNVLVTVDSKLPELIMDYDPEKWRQILVNLLSNALKYTPSGGTIRIGLEFVGSLKFDPEGSGRSSKLGGHGPVFGEDQWLSLTVADSGAGIAAEDLPHIFDRFYQADNAVAKAGGTGIGLALTKELVKLLGGEIAVESAPGQGTKFTILLPITTRAETAPGLDNNTVIQTSPLQTSNSEHQTSNSEHQTSNSELPTILIIEDSPDVVEYLRLCLDGQYGLDFAFNGRAGIERALELVPDLILSDVMMPEKDGFEVCDALKNDERTSHIPVVLLTAKADVESRIAGLRRGADAYLAKPFHQEELLVTLANLLESRRRLQAKYAASALTPVSVASAAVQDQPPAADPEDAFLQKLRAALETRLGDPNLSVEDVCRTVGMGRSNLYAKLSALTNLSFNIYLRTLRLHKAKLLLETTDMNVSEAAYEVGFNDPKYFSRVFSEQFGLAPSEAKK